MDRAQIETWIAEDPHVAEHLQEFGAYRETEDWANDAGYIVELASDHFPQLRHSRVEFTYDAGEEGGDAGPDGLMFLTREDGVRLCTDWYAWCDITTDREATGVDACVALLTVLEAKVADLKQQLHGLLISRIRQAVDVEVNRAAVLAATCPGETCSQAEGARQALGRVTELLDSDARQEPIRNRLVVRAPTEDVAGDEPQAAWPLDYVPAWGGPTAAWTAVPDAIEDGRRNPGRWCDDTNGRWACSRPIGHTGDHAAYSNGDFCERWLQEGRPQEGRPRHSALGVTDGANRTENICSHIAGSGYVCTRPSRHDGDHAAWDRTRLLERWPAERNRSRVGVEDGMNNGHAGDVVICDQHPPDGEYTRYYCTRPRNHDYDHAAWAGGTLCIRWSPVEADVEDGGVAHPGLLNCGAGSPGRGWTCTRPDGHVDDHAAWRVREHLLLIRWAR